MNPGWMLPDAAFRWIEATIETGERILEFGSGDGSERLVEHYEMTSIEHDISWVGRTRSTYIHAPIVFNQTSNQYGQEGWYDFTALEDLPEAVSLIIVDGPPGEIGRMGLLEHLNILPKWKFMLVDDTDRSEEMELSAKLCEHFGCSSTRIETEQFKANGDKRMFDILENR